MTATMTPAEHRYRQSIYQLGLRWVRFSHRIDWEIYVMKSIKVDVTVEATDDVAFGYVTAFRDTL